MSDHSPTPAPQPTLAPAVKPNHDGRDWPEDFAHENGQYYNICTDCGKGFVGHKRRPTCKLCSPAAPQEGTTPPASSGTTTDEIERILAVYGVTREELDAINHLQEVCGDSQGENDMAMAILWGALTGARAELRTARALTSSQPDSSLRAAEPDLSEFRLAFAQIADAVDIPHGSLNRTTAGIVEEVAALVATSNDYKASLTQAEAEIERLRASSPTVTPPQTWPDLWCEACREYVPVTDDATKSECGVGEAPYDLCCTRCAAILATYQPSNPEAASPPVTEEAPNEDTALLDYLETKVVNVREPTLHGSLDLFWANPGDDGPSDLRVQIRAARSTPTEGRTNAE